jgi:hypothetical protein
VLTKIILRFYTGALTYSSKGGLRIPNPDARKEFVEAGMRLLEVDKSLFKLCRNGISKMLQEEDITLLCSSFAEAHKEERGVRDIIQGEISFQEGTGSLQLNCCASSLYIFFSNVSPSFIFVLL